MECTKFEPCQKIGCEVCDYKIDEYVGTKMERKAGRYSQNQMLRVFALVEPKPNWKYPVDAWTHLRAIREAMESPRLTKKDAAAVMIKAVVHFTGTNPELLWAGSRVQVLAEGYYAMEAQGEAAIEDEIEIEF
jgi:hypothetical protein